MTLGGGGGVRQSVTQTFLFLKILFLMLLEEKLVITKQDAASKDTFFFINLIFQSNIGLKISHQKMKNVTWWGVKKVPKKCHVLFEWPL